MAEQAPTATAVQAPMPTTFSLPPQSPAQNGPLAIEAPLPYAPRCGARTSPAGMLPTKYRVNWLPAHPVSPVCSLQRQMMRKTSSKHSQRHRVPCQNSTNNEENK